MPSDEENPSVGEALAGDSSVIDAVEAAQEHIEIRRGFTEPEEPADPGPMTSRERYLDELGEQNALHTLSEAIQDTYRPNQNGDAFAPGVLQTAYEEFRRRSNPVVPGLTAQFQDLGGLTYLSGGSFTVRREALDGDTFPVGSEVVQNGVSIGRVLSVSDDTIDVALTQGEMVPLQGPFVPLSAQGRIDAVSMGANLYPAQRALLRDVPTRPAPEPPSRYPQFREGQLMRTEAETRAYAQRLFDTWGDPTMDQHLDEATEIVESTGGSITRTEALQALEMGGPEAIHALLWGSMTPGPPIIGVDPGIGRDHTGVSLIERDSAQADANAITLAVAEGHYRYAQDLCSSHIERLEHMRRAQGDPAVEPDDTSDLMTLYDHISTDDE